MKIILEGTSSSGKSSIVKLFPKKYKKVALDDLEYNKEELYKIVKNKYYKNEEMDKMFYNIISNRLSSRVKGSSDFIIDQVDPKNLSKLINKLPNTTVRILLYTNLNDLVDNIDKRKIYDARGLFVFKQFTQYYVKTDDNGIDIININDFIEYLKKIKFFFENEKELVKFAKDIFKDLGITDKKNHNIKPRISTYNYLLNSKGKTPTELKNIILNLSK